MAKNTTKNDESIRLGKLLRKARGTMTAGDAAERLGCSRSHLWGVENGGHTVSLTLLRKAAKLYKLSLAKCLGGGE